jgi:hypothetical protein
MRPLFRSLLSLTFALLGGWPVTTNPQSFKLLHSNEETFSHS